MRQDEFFENPYGPPANKAIFVIRSCSRAWLVNEPSTLADYFSVVSHGKRAVPRPAMTDFLSEGGGGGHGEAQGDGRRSVAKYEVCFGRY